MTELFAKPQECLSEPEICLLFQNDALASFVSSSKILLEMVGLASGVAMFQYNC